ncbi:MAG TPA: transglycosylase family protein [Candidatus Saccharimonadales bacterium]|nr:transglycosylase family protein [Candidatus Saccharimonadales bacterium]
MISIYTIPIILDLIVENTGRVAGRIFKAGKVQFVRTKRNLNKAKSLRYVGYVVLATTLILPMTLVSAASTSPITTTVAGVQAFGPMPTVQALTPQVAEVSGARAISIEVTPSSLYLDEQARLKASEAVKQAAAQAVAKKAITTPVAAKPQGDMLAAIRYCESRNDYQAQNRRSSASGAYQFLDSTWARFGGYQRAKDAPAEIQDQKASQALQLRGTAPWNASRSCWARYVG